MDWRYTIHGSTVHGSTIHGSTIIGPAVAADGDRMAAAIVRAIGKHPAPAAGAHLGEGDFLRTVRHAPDRVDRGETESPWLAKLFGCLTLRPSSPSRRMASESFGLSG